MSMHPGNNYFRQYKQDCAVWIETGTYRGEGLNLAYEAGFLEMHSIDIEERKDIAYKYPGYGTVKRYIDSSPTVLNWLLPTIDAKCQFWLDAHWQMFDGTDPGPNPFPLLDELREIAKHKRNDHVIIIDDMLIMQKDITGYDFNDIKAELLKINPNYILERLPNPIINGILIAHV